MNTRWICHLSGALLISTLQGAENFWDEIPLSPSTTLPSVVLDDYWNSEFQRVNREVAAAQNTRLVFFGDSITWSAPPRATAWAPPSPNASRKMPTSSPLSSTSWG
jgi:hypothetical protein